MEHLIMKQKLILFLIGLATSLSLFIGLASHQDQSPNSVNLELRQTETTPAIIAAKPSCEEKDKNDKTCPYGIAKPNGVSRGG